MKFGIAANDGKEIEWEKFKGLNPYDCQACEFKKCCKKYKKGKRCKKCPKG